MGDLAVATNYNPGTISTVGVAGAQPALTVGYDYGMQPNGSMSSGATNYLQGTADPQVASGGYSNPGVVGSAAPAPVYRDAYGNVRGSAGEATAANQRGSAGQTSANNYIGANDVQWGNFQTGYGTRGRNMVDTATGTQDTINTSRGNNALNLRRSMAAIANGVRQGLQSGGVNLANMNALDSGAAEAMARAWARAGTGQVGDARSSAAAQNRVLDTDQGNLARYMRNEMSDLSNYGRGQVNTQRASLGQNLDATAVGLQDVGLQGLIDTGADERWADNATNWLLQQDAGFQGQLNGIQAWSPDQIEAKAYEWDMAGREGVSPFTIDNVGTGIQIGAGGEGNVPGAPVSQLPIYTRNRRYS